MAEHEAGQPKHRQLFEAIKRDILGGRYDPARRIPSEVEFARKFKVSRPTVAHALRELVSLGLLERRAGSGTYLKPVARQSGRKFGLIAGGLGNSEILEPICRQIARELEQSGSTLLWGDSLSMDADYSARQAEALCGQYVQQQVAGVFFAPLEEPADRERINLRIVERLSAANIPVALLDRDVTEFPRRSGYDMIGIDNFAGAMVLTEHLIGVGAKRVHFVTRPHPPGTTDLRIAGCREALVRAGLALPIKHVHGIDPGDETAVGAIMGRHQPDAFVCCNDQVAAHLIRTLNACGLGVPNNVRVAGFDDVRYASLLNVPLTTIRQPCEAIGQAAVAMLRHRSVHRQRPAMQILMPMELVVRQSSGMG